MKIEEIMPQIREGKIFYKKKLNENKWPLKKVHMNQSGIRVLISQRYSSDEWKYAPPMTFESLLHDQWEILA